MGKHKTCARSTSKYKLTQPSSPQIAKLDILLLLPVWSRVVSASALTSVLRAKLLLLLSDNRGVVLMYLSMGEGIA